MKDVSIGGVILLDRPELGADEKEEVSVLYSHLLLRSIFCLLLFTQHSLFRLLSQSS